MLITSITPVLNVLKFAIVKSNDQMRDINEKIDAGQQSGLTGALDAISVAIEENDHSRCADIRDKLSEVRDYYGTMLHNRSAQVERDSEGVRMRLKRVVNPYLDLSVMDTILNPVRTQNAAKTRLTECFVYLNNVRYAEIARLICTFLLRGDLNPESAVVEKSFRNITMESEQAKWGTTGFHDVHFVISPLCRNMISIASRSALEHQFYLPKNAEIDSLMQDKLVTRGEKQEVLFTHYFGNYMSHMIFLTFMSDGYSNASKAGGTPELTMRAFAQAFFDHARLEHAIRGSTSPIELLNIIAFPKPFFIPFRLRHRNLGSRLVN